VQFASARLAASGILEVSAFAGGTSWDVFCLDILTLLYTSASMLCTAGATDKVGVDLEGDVSNRDDAVCSADLTGYPSEFPTYSPGM
jgi:hypothetical protein